MDEQEQMSLEQLATNIFQLQQGVAALTARVQRLEDRLDDRGRDEAERAPPYLPRR